MNQKSNNKFKDFFDYIKGKKPNLNTKVRNFPFSRNVAIILTLIFAIVTYFIFLPPINIHAKETWLYLMAIQLVLIILAGRKIPGIKARFIFLLAMALIYFVLNLTSIELFTAKAYANVIKIENGDFKKDITEPSLDKIPTLDRDSAETVGSRKMGELLDLASQFDLDSEYTQINYQEKPVRTTPLKYNGLLKYLFNFRNGLPGYMTVDIVNGKANLVKLDKGIKYTKNDLLLRNIKLYTRLKYPLEIFDHMEFEIDDQGIPHWVIPTYKNSVGWFGAYDVKNVITVNAITGESNLYPVESAPQWIDRVYESEKIMQQLDWNGMYKLGFLNSKFAQKQVLQTTEGYNYIALNDDIYLYTGLTSVASDESNVGFIMTNLRTKETKFYPVSSAKETSAMRSAEGAVQDQKYLATFPLLFNIKGNPTYFLSLKDNNGLIKSYAFIDSQDYQKVSVANSVREAYSKHTGTIIENNEFDETTEFTDKSGKIADIYSVVIDGNTHYYFTLEGDTSTVYVSSVKLSDQLPFIQKGANVKFKFAKTTVNKVVSFEEIKNEKK